jgi:hypothetical protein
MICEFSNAVIDKHWPAQPPASAPTMIEKVLLRPIHIVMLSENP